MIYLGASPIYWLPGIAPDTLRTIKLLLIATPLLVLFVTRSKTFMHSLNSQIFGVFGYLLLLLCALPGLLQSSVSNLYITVLAFSLVFLMLWGARAYFISTINPNNILILSAVIIGGFCLLVNLSFLTGFPNFISPYENGQALTVAGFGAKRTGWSNGIALFIPLLFLVLVDSRKVTFRRQLFTYAFALFIFGSQLIVGGRGGIVASLIGFSMIFGFILPKKLIVPSTLVVSLLAVLAFSLYSNTGDLEDKESVQENVLSHFRLDRLDSNRSNRFDRFSAGRLGQFECAWMKFKEQPLFGHGFTDESECLGADIHNLWLKLLVQSGLLIVVFLFIFITIISMRLITSFVQLKRVKNAELHVIRKTMAIYLAVLLQGVFVSLIEPNALIGSFQATAIWWVVLGFSLSLHERTKKIKMDIRSGLRQ